MLQPEDLSSDQIIKLEEILAKSRENESWNRWNELDEELSKLLNVKAEIKDDISKTLELTHSHMQFIGYKKIAKSLTQTLELVIAVL